MRSRPLGVTVLSMLMLLNVATYLALFVFSILNRETLRVVLIALSPGGAGPANFHLQMGAFLPLYYAAMTVITAVIAIGFWKLWNWTHIVVLALVGISLIAALPEAVHVISGGSAGAIATLLVRVTVSVLIGWYLMSGKVRKAFWPTATSRVLESL
jgi:hypothetical protein